jgi:hypothetical protein
MGIALVAAFAADATAKPPVAFTKADALWATDVPPGHSSPVVWGEKIFLTCIENGKLDCR